MCVCVCVCLCVCVCVCACARARSCQELRNSNTKESNRKQGQKALNEYAIFQLCAKTVNLVWDLQCDFFPGGNDRQPLCIFYVQTRLADSF